MFDGLIHEVGERSGLGDKTAELLAALLAIVFDERLGGIAGLLAKIRQHGGGEATTGWVGNPQAAAVDPRVLDGALGPETLPLLAGRLNAPVAIVANAAATLLPALIGHLTPGGRLPVSVPTAVAGYLVRFPSLESATSPRARRHDATALPRSYWLRWGLLLASVLVLGHCVAHHFGGHFAAAPTTTAEAGRPAAGASARIRP